MNPTVYEYKTLDYKGKTVFAKTTIGEFKRIDKHFQENEACFMFIDLVSSFFKPLEYDFKTIIEKNIYSSLSLSELAMLCGMSLASFLGTDVMYLPNLNTTISVFTLMKEKREINANVSNKIIEIIEQQ